MFNVMYSYKDDVSYALGCPEQNEPMFVVM